MVHSVVARFLRTLDPETAHRLTIKALSFGLGPKGKVDRSGTCRIADLDFPNPLGVAAGFDKDAEAFESLLRMGFGHVEVGTVTPRPQLGNPRPRAFRLSEDQAVINRYGFNNAGFDAAHGRLAKARGRGLDGVIGVNVGANKDAEDRAADYAVGIMRFADVASYMTINVSSPNTPGLRDLQGGEALRELLGRVAEARSTAPKHRPVFLKIAPDLDEQGIETIVAEADRAELDGLIVSNTTLDRSGLRSRHAKEAGGLSGAPLFHRSTELLRRVRDLAPSRLALIGVGGVGSASDVQAKLGAGADLVQLYTALTFHGPALVSSMLTRLANDPNA